MDFDIGGPFIVKFHTIALLLLNELVEPSDEFVESLDSTEKLPNGSLGFRIGVAFHSYPQQDRPF